jgi:ferredoxin
MRDQNQDEFKIEFRKSGHTEHWNKDVESLLELAEDAGVYADSSCQSGTRHTCLVQVIEGTFDYGDNDVFAPENDDEILICSAVPTSNMVINV